MKGQSKTLIVRYGGREQCEYENNFQMFKKNSPRENSKNSECCNIADSISVKKHEKHYDKGVLTSDRSIVSVSAPASLNRISSGLRPFFQVIFIPSYASA
jgi:hypothetical protein